MASLGAGCLEADNRRAVGVTASSWRDRRSGPGSMSNPETGPADDDQRRAAVSIMTYVINCRYLRHWD